MSNRSFETANQFCLTHSSVIMTKFNKIKFMLMINCVSVPT